MAADTEREPREAPESERRPRLRMTGAQLRAFCERWKLVEFSLFGSILREDWDDDSDIDVLVELREGVHWPWSGLPDMREEREALTGRQVDIGFRKGLVEAANPFRSREILRTARRVYAAAHRSGAPCARMNHEQP